MPTSVTGICSKALITPDRRIHRLGAPLASRMSTRFPQSSRGFTLLEVLVVLFIIGIIVSFATLSVSQNTSRVVADEAERLQGLIRLSSEEAVLQGNELALQFNRDGYGFVMLSRSNEWQPLEDDKLLRQREIPAGVHLELMLEGTQANLGDTENPPRIFVLSSGELTPFELIVRSDDGDRYRLTGSLDGKLELVEIGERDV